MKVMTHQTIGQNIHAMLPTLVRHPRQIGFPIVIGQKDSFPAVPALGDVMRNCGKNRSSETRHRGTFSYRHKKR